MAVIGGTEIVASFRLGGSGGVSSLNGLTGAVIFAAGTGITLTPAGNTVTIAASGGQASSMKLSPINLLAGGADAINPHTAATYLITHSGVDSITIAAPTVGTDDGIVINVTSNTPASHTITFTGGTLRSGSAGVTTVTFAAFAGSSVSFYAYQGVWYVLSQNLIASYT